MRGLRDKAGVIAGGGRGIGAATARRLATEGAAIVIGDIEAGWAEATAASIREAGGRAVGQAVDITDDASVAALVERASTEFGRFDFMHANAAGGTVGDSDALDVDLAVFERSLALNLTGYLRCTRAALPRLIGGGGGAIVYTGSGAAYGGMPIQPGYAVAKNGLHALARHVAARWGKQAIRCNVVSPGVVLTEAVSQHLTPEFTKVALARTPSPRLGEPDDIAAMVALLVSDDGAWVNGQVISVNGGAAMRD